MDKIDFVLPWVDGSDSAWIKQRNEYLGIKNDQTQDSRFRDWENLQYWFRGVEKFAPWVNHIYFVTWGHIPSWLNTDHPKLTVVKHEDYIPKQYLPTFSSHPIELNMHRIRGLSEQFVYFNDDTFIINKMEPEDFFRNGLPRDYCIETALVQDDIVCLHSYEQCGTCKYALFKERSDWQKLEKMVSSCIWKNGIQKYADASVQGVFQF